MKIAIAGDHSAYSCKQALLPFLKELGHEVQDMGCYDTTSVDYPDYAPKVAHAVLSGAADRGILICATGIGMSIAANKIEGIRCALCTDPVMARLTREHNDSNILALGARISGPAVIEDIVYTWLNTNFSGDARHQRRIEAVMNIEKSQ